MMRYVRQFALACSLTLTSVGLATGASAQAPAAPAQGGNAVGAVVRRVIMKDALSAEAFKQRLEGMKSTGLFRDQLTSFDPKKPINTEITFLVSGNYILVVGSKEWVDTNIDTIRVMAFLFDRPRAHLQLNLRVVQLTGPANADVIQMSETIRALVEARRDEVVRTFSDLDEYLTRRMQERQGREREILDAIQELFPTLGTGTRQLTVPETLFLLMLDRTSPAPRSTKLGTGMSREIEMAFMALPRYLGAAIQDPHTNDEEVIHEIEEELASWKAAVTAARDWCVHYGTELKKRKDGSLVTMLHDALEHPNTPIPSWLARRLQRSIELTERLYPNLARKHTEETLSELARRFTVTLERAESLERSLKVEMQPDPNKKGSVFAPGTLTSRRLVELKSLAEELIPAPMALFESVALAADNGAPNPEQLITLLREYSVERRKLDQKVSDSGQTVTRINYGKLQSLEASLNLWLRRVSEAMARALEQQFYRRYVDELRLLANKQLGKLSNREILGDASIQEVPDITRDLLLSDSGVNIFVSNSISMQFAPDTTNTVSAQVQAQLPSKQGLLERIQQANQAASQLNALSQAFGINGESLVKALLAGGQAVPVQGGVNLSATPSIGFDAGTVTLSLTANQVLQPNTDKVADRVTNHSINNATVTALSYEPMVLSTLASNVSYYENTGGIPIVRKTPILKDLAKDIPFAPFKEGKRQKGVYQSSVIILEPIVIPTIEDLVRFHSGWRDDQGTAGTAGGANPYAEYDNDEAIPAEVVDAALKAAAAAQQQAPAVTPMQAPAAPMAAPMPAPGTAPAPQAPAPTPPAPPAPTK